MSLHSKKVCSKSNVTFSVIRNWKSVWESKYFNIHLALLVILSAKPLGLFNIQTIIYLLTSFEVYIISTNTAWLVLAQATPPNHDPALSRFLASLERKVHSTFVWRTILDESGLGNTNCGYKRLIQSFRFSNGQSRYSLVQNIVQENHFSSI